MIKKKIIIALTLLVFQLQCGDTIDITFSGFGAADSTNAIKIIKDIEFSGFNLIQESKGFENSIEIIIKLKQPLSHYDFNILEFRPTTYNKNYWAFTYDQVEELSKSSQNNLLVFPLRVSESRGKLTFISLGEYNLTFDKFPLPYSINTFKRNQKLSNIEYADYYQPDFFANPIIDTAFLNNDTVHISIINQDSLQIEFIEIQTYVNDDDKEYVFYSSDTLYGDFSGKRNVVGVKHVDSLRAYTGYIYSKIAGIPEGYYISATKQDVYIDTSSNVITIK